MTVVKVVVTLLVGSALGVAGTWVWVVWYMSKHNPS